MTFKKGISYNFHSGFPTIALVFYGLLTVLSNHKLHCYFVHCFLLGIIPFLGIITDLNDALGYLGGYDEFQASLGGVTNCFGDQPWAGSQGICWPLSVFWSLWWALSLNGQSVISNPSSFYMTNLMRHIHKVLSHFNVMTNYCDSDCDFIISALKFVPGVCGLELCVDSICRWWQPCPWKHNS